MTPLAQRVFRQLTIPVRQRTLQDDAGVLDKLNDLHCFEMSAVAVAVNEAIERDHAPIVETCAHLLREMFLPSPRTWLEYRHEDDSTPGVPGQRSAVMIEQVASTPRLKFLLTLAIEEPFCTAPIGVFWAPTVLDPARSWAATATIATNDWTRNLPEKDRQAMLNRFIIETLLFLDIINTPNLVALKTVQPHRGLERALRQGGVGRYPLQAWHEVLIKPGVLDEEGEREGHLTGRKCLHFTRAHKKRLRSGVVGRVSHYWSGDPALGIRRTRYRVGR